MMMHNAHLEPGTWQHTGSDNVVVVTSVVTHHYKEGEMKPVPPLVIYRDLLATGHDHIAYMMDLETFKAKFIQLTLYAEVKPNL